MATTKLTGTKFSLSEDFTLNPDTATVRVAPYLPSAAGGVARTIHEKLGDVVSVKDFGAVGDGVTDDTAAIQAALNASGIVFVSPGVYRVTGPILVPSDCILYGAGPSSVIALGAGVNTSVLVNSNNPGANANIIIRDLCIDGNVSQQTNNGSYNKHAVRMRQVDRLTIQDCEIKDSGTDCINLIDCPNATIRGNHLHRAYNHAVTFEGCHGLRAIGNEVHDCGSKTDALGFSSSGHAFIGVNTPCNEVQILANFVYDMGDSCLRNESGGEGWTIADNVVVRSGKDSIKIMGRTVGSSRTIFLSNTTNFLVGDTVTGASSTATATVTAVNSGAGTITVTMPGSGVAYKYFQQYETLTSSSGGSATISRIVSDHAKANVVTGNVIVDAGNHAIVANGSAACVISSNVIRRTGTNLAGAAASKWFASASGISVTDNAAEVVITDNSIDGAYAAGISLIDVFAPVVRGNTVYRSGGDGINFDRVDRATIENNICADNSAAAANVSAGIRGAMTANTGTGWGRHRIRGNRCFNHNATGQRWGIRIEQGGGQVGASFIEGNDLLNNQTGPLFTNWTGAGNVIRRNTGYVTENKGTGVVPSGSTLVAVPHGLSITPSAAQIKVTPTNSMGAATKMWVGATNSTVFQVLTNVDPGVSTATFSWQIEA